MKYDNFYFTVIRERCDKFKQKQMTMLRHIIEASRLLFDMEFASYGLIEFEESDERHIHPIIEETETYNRLKTNCLIYNLPVTAANKGYYDKIFIYQSNGVKRNGYYGWLLYNSKTGEYKHKYYIDRLEDELCRQLNKAFNIMRFREKYLPYT